MQNLSLNVKRDDDEDSIFSNQRSNMRRPITRGGPTNDKEET